MKKLLSVLLSMVLMVVSIPVYADTNEKEDKVEIIDKTFTSMYDIRNSEISDIEIGKNKLLQAGYTEEFINSLPERMLLKAKNAISVHRTIRYFTADGNDLVQIDKNEFEKIREQKNKSNDLEKRLEAIKVVSSKENIFNDNEYSSDTTRASKSFDNGTIKVSMDVFKVNGGEKGQFWALCTYNWTDLPDFCNKDFVGITRDEKSSVIEESAAGVWTYKYDKYQLYAGPEGVVSSKINDYTEDEEVDFEDLEISEGSAYIMGVPMPPNYWPGSMVQGTFGVGFLPTAAYGAIEYDGIASSPDVSLNINHWGTYAHQYKNLWFDSVSFSYPLGVSFTVKPEKKFKKVVDEDLWRYRP